MNKGIWIFVVIVIIVVVYLIVKKNKSTQEIPNAVQNLVNNSGLGNVISSPNTPNNTVVIKTNNYKIGDSIYSKDTTNTYKSASVSASNLDSFKSFQKDELIGTYLATDGVFTKVLIANPAHSVFVLSNQIYSK